MAAALLMFVTAFLVAPLTLRLELIISPGEVPRWEKPGEYVERLGKFVC